MNSSPSRTYVCMCVADDRLYFKRFVLPEGCMWERWSYGAIKLVKMPNDVVAARWWFMNKLDRQKEIKACMPIEDYQNITEQ